MFTRKLLERSASLPGGQVPRNLSVLQPPRRCLSSSLSCFGRPSKSDHHEATTTAASTTTTTTMVRHVCMRRTWSGPPSHTHHTTQFSSLSPLSLGPSNGIRLPRSPSFGRRPSKPLFVWSAAETPHGAARTSRVEMVHAAIQNGEFPRATTLFSFVSCLKAASRVPSGLGHVLE